MIKKKVRGRRTRRTVRRAFGALFMTMAIAVAAVPVDKLKADVRNDTSYASQDSIVVDQKNCGIPFITDLDTTIYTTGDGRFQFAYYSEDGSIENKYAIILGYNGGQLDNGVLELPNTVDAYRKYIDNLGGNGQGYCAVGKSGNFLFYKKTDTHSEYKLDANGEKIPKTLTNEDGTPATDEEGNPIYQTDESGNIIYLSEEVSTTSYMPCYFSDEGWQGLTNDDYYYLDSAGKYQPATDSSHMRITNAQVRYVGNQYLTTGTGADEGVWKIANNVVGGKNDYGIVDTPEKGIFRGGVAGNIVTLKIGSNLCGIGDYAFNGCANMTSIELANGLDTIGNHAFENCINMRTVEIAPEARLTTIGAYAFYNHYRISLHL